MKATRHRRSAFSSVLRRASSCRSATNGDCLEAELIGRWQPCAGAGEIGEDPEDLVILLGVHYPRPGHRLALVSELRRDYPAHQCGGRDPVSGPSILDRWRDGRLGIVELDSSLSLRCAGIDNDRVGSTVDRGEQLA